MKLPVWSLLWSCLTGVDAAGLQAVGMSHWSHLQGDCKPMATTKTTDSEFSTHVLQSDTPVLVDFWAEWCGPCKAIGPALEEISEAKGDAISIVKLNIDENPMTPQQYNVRGIPTLLIFKGGEVIAEKVGALPKSQLESWINQSIA